ncbi:MAG: HAD family hydrolase [Crocinitomicaceae bacterium]
MMNFLEQINSDWTLFLDRDGVINKKRDNDYVKSIEEFEFIEGVLESLKVFSELFGKVVVVTNQQGIGKGIMTESNLREVHGYMLEEVKKHGGRIDQIYFAPHLASENSNDRKPGTGMGLKAQIDFPEIDFEKSLLIGDSESDIEFGTKLGMKTIMLKNNREIESKADLICQNLKDVKDQMTNL